jgi:hypothetical protein
MKFQNSLLGFVCLFLGSATCTRSQVVTLWSSGGTSAPVLVTLTNNQVAEVKTLLIAPKYASGWEGKLLISSGGVAMALHQGWQTNGPCLVSGPATIELTGGSSGGVDTPAMATLDIQPGPFPPDKAVTVGAYSGNVQVTMEMSTDLVNWTTAVNAAVYTNSPDARFFRIKLVTNASR